MRWVDVWPSALHSVFSPGDEVALPDQLFRLIKDAYAPIGGYLDFERPSDLPGNHDVWRVLIEGAVAHAVLFGKQTAYGIKWTGVAPAQTVEARKEIVRELRILLTRPGNYAEVSGGCAYHLLGMPGCVVINDQDVVRSILQKPLVWCAEGWYERFTHGCIRKKIMVGHPNVIAKEQAA